MPGKGECTGPKLACPGELLAAARNYLKRFLRKGAFHGRRIPRFRTRHIQGEIATHFGLGAPSAARVKVKRAGWITEPPNHPADPRRIRVPRGVWEKAAETPGSTKPETPGPKARENWTINEGGILALFRLPLAPSLQLINSLV